MSCFDIHGPNLIYQSTITASSENSMFPKENIKDNRRTKVYRSTNSEAWIILDFGETSDIDTIFIMSEKRNGFGFNSITFEFNQTSNFSSPAYSTTIDFSEKHYLGHKEITKISYRFCRIVMQSSSTYCELSKIYIGSKLNLSKSIKFGWNFKDEDLSIKSVNRYGQAFIDKIPSQKKLNFSFNYLNKDDLALILDLIDFCGIDIPIFVKIGDETMSDDYRRVSGGYFLTDIPQVTNSHFNKYLLSMSLIEVT